MEIFVTCPTEDGHDAHGTIAQGFTEPMVFKPIDVDCPTCGEPASSMQGRVTADGPEFTMTPNRSKSVAEVARLSMFA